MNFIFKMSIQTIEEAEEYYAVHARRIDADRLAVNSIVGGVALGHSRNWFVSACKVLGVRTRRTFVGPVRRFAMRCPDFDPAVAKTPATIAEFRKRKGLEK